LSRDYFFNLSTEQAIIPLQALLEKKELDLFIKIITEAIKAPKQDYMKFVQRTLGNFGATASSGPIYKILNEAEQRQLREFDEECKHKTKVLDPLVSMYSSFSRSGRIKQGASELENTLRVGEQIVQAFFEDKLMGQSQLSEDQLKPFWQQADVKIGDYSGFTEYLLISIFGEAFMTPLEVTDETFIINARAPDLQEWVQHIYVNESNSPFMMSDIEVLSVS